MNKNYNFNKKFFNLKKKLYNLFQVKANHLNLIFQIHQQIKLHFILLFFPINHFYLKNKNKYNKKNYLLDYFEKNLIIV